MRLVFVLLLLTTATEIFSQACCCTGAGVNYTILPNIDMHVVGFRYGYRNFYNEKHSLNSEQNGMVTKQHLHTTEIFGRFNLNKHLQLSVFLPVSVISQNSSNKLETTSGLGDMSLLLQYQVLDPLKCTGKKYKHQLRIGAGVKLPSGEFEMNNNNMFVTNLQLGTGSVDFVFSSIYTLRISKIGLNTSVTYRMNTSNPQQYKFGNRAQSSVQLFYLAEVKNVQIMPSLAVNYEHQSRNLIQKQLLSYTGGSFLTASIGFDVYYKQFAFSSVVTPALMNKLNWNGENKNRIGIEAGVFYNFSTLKK